MVQAVNLPPPLPAIVTEHSVNVKSSSHRLKLHASPIHLGSKNDQVEALQAELRNLGFSNVQIDGEFGQSTDTALRTFQKANGLPVDGVLGPRTIGAIKRMCANYDSDKFEMSPYSHFAKGSGTGLKGAPPIMSVISVRMMRVSDETAVASAGRSYQIPSAPYDAVARRKATEDLGRIRNLAPMISRIAERYDIAPPILAAIVSRESRGRNVIGDSGYGHGLAQVDSGSFGVWTRRWRASGMPAEEGLRKGAEIFANKRSYLRGQFPNLTEDKLTAATLSSYNAGEGTVAWALRRGASPDRYTTGRNYSRDALNRAAVFAAQFPNWDANN